MRRNRKFFQGVRRFLAALEEHGQSPTAELLAQKIRSGDICFAVIDRRIQPWGNPRQAYPRSALFMGKRDGERWMLSAVDSIVTLDEKAPRDVSELFLALACTANGEGAECGFYVWCNARRLGLDVSRGRHVTTIALARTNEGGP